MQSSAEVLEVSMVFKEAMPLYLGLRPGKTGLPVKTVQEKIVDGFVCEYL